MLLTIQEKDYLIPERWTQVRLGQYQSFMEKIEDIDDQKVIDKIAISSFTGLSMPIIDKVRKGDVDVIRKHLFDLTKKPMNTTLNTIIEIDGIDYGFHPKLKDLTFGEFVDLDNYLADAWKNMHYIMAILYRPIVSQKKKKYAIEDYDADKCFDRAQVFKDNLSVATVNGAATFFLTIGVEYQAVMKSSLNKQTKLMKKKKDLQTTMTSTLSGVGTE